MAAATACGCGAFVGNGIPLTPELPVNESKEGDQVSPKVASDAAGNFVVVWRGLGVDGAEIFARLFAASGSPLTDEFVINQQVTGFQLTPHVDRNDRGSFVVTWREARDIWVTVRDAAGTSVVPERVVNDSGEHEAFAVQAGALRSDGGFLVTWDATYPSEREVYQRLYDPEGNPLSPEFQLSDGGKFYPSQAPDVAVDESDSFRVVWHTSLNLQDYGVYSRRTDSNGNVGPVQELVAPTFGGRFSAARPGDFVVVHADYCGASCVFEGLRFDVDGNLVDTFSVPTESAVALEHRSDDARDFVLVEVVGDSLNQDLYGWTFDSPLFCDGFESGNTSAWDLTVP